jgi:hypothetical protein
VSIFFRVLSVVVLSGPWPLNIPLRHVIGISTLL